jgi:hypothetical protein
MEVEKSTHDTTDRRTNKDDSGQGTAVSCALLSLCDGYLSTWFSSTQSSRGTLLDCSSPEGDRRDKDIDVRAIRYRHCTPADKQCAGVSLSADSRSTDETHRRRSFPMSTIRRSSRLGWSTRNLIIFGLIALCILGLLLVCLFLILGKKFKKNKRTTTTGTTTTTKAVVTKGVSPDQRYQQLPTV